MQGLLPPSSRTSRAEGYMTALSGREVSPSAPPSESRRLSRTVILSTTFVMGNEFLTKMASPSRSPEQSSGNPRSARQRRYISGARTAGGQRYFAGSQVTTLSGQPVFREWWIPPTGVAPSVESEKNIFTVPSKPLGHPTMTPDPISSPPNDELVDRSSIHGDSPTRNSGTRLGEVDTHQRGRHRRPRNGFSSRGRSGRHSGRRASSLSSLWRALEQLFGRKPMRGQHRIRTALTPTQQPASITSSAQSPTEGTTS